MIDPQGHIANVRANLQLIADFSCAAMTLFVPSTEGLRVEDSVRPTTCARYTPLRQIGSIADASKDAEVYECLGGGKDVLGVNKGGKGSAAFVSCAYPVGRCPLYGVLVRDMPVDISYEPGSMEDAFIDIALHLIKSLKYDAFRYADTLAPFSTTRTVSDAVIYLGSDREALYSTPNAYPPLPWSTSCSIHDTFSSYPEYEHAVSAALTENGCSAIDLQMGNSIFSLRVLPCNPGAVVLAGDVSELRERDRELRVREAMIQEIHHRVKNNLQTVESLFRMHMRRTTDLEVGPVFDEAITRIRAMSMVHEMLSCSPNECVDILSMTRAVAEQVRVGLVGVDSSIKVEVRGEKGLPGVPGVSSFALVIAEIVHNAIEHGLRDRNEGVVSIVLVHEGRDLVVMVEDDGCGLPKGFSLEEGTSKGLFLMRSLVEDDLSGEVTCESIEGGHGARFVLRIPLAGCIEKA